MEPRKMKGRGGGGGVGRKKIDYKKITDIYKLKKNFPVLFITNLLKLFQGNKKTSHQLLSFTVFIKVNVP